jgi:hypothetical protein
VQQPVTPVIEKQEPKPQPPPPVVETKEATVEQEELETVCFDKK